MKKDRSSEDNLGVSTGKKRRSIYARGQDRQEAEERLKRLSVKRGAERFLS